MINTNLVEGQVRQRDKKGSAEEGRLKLGFRAKAGVCQVETGALRTKGSDTIVTSV